jgi:hypothetical protein
LKALHKIAATPAPTAAPTPIHPTLGGGVGAAPLTTVPGILLVTNTIAALPESLLAMTKVFVAVAVTLVRVLLTLVHWPLASSTVVVHVPVVVFQGPEFVGNGQLDQSPPLGAVQPPQNPPFPFPFPFPKLPEVKGPQPLQEEEEEEQEDHWEQREDSIDVAEANSLPVQAVETQELRVGVAQYEEKSDGSDWAHAEE